jgi:membrane protein implicated in regulation of membrane protease activity
MYLILIAWFYVVLMMAIAEATNPAGSLLGACITFALYGLLPMGIAAYILGTPMRKRRLRAQREAEQRAWDAAHAQQATPAPAAQEPAPPSAP